MEIVIAGGTGFIGRHIVEYLKKRGFGVAVIRREDFLKDGIRALIENKDVLINLTGESIAGRWTKKKKEKIYKSRINTTKKLISEINACKRPVKTIIQVSAIGIYDSEHEHDEESKSYAKGFLAEVVRDWEAEAMKVNHEIVRLVIVRLGIVLDRDGGLIKKLLLTLNVRLGISIESVKKEISFIHMRDLEKIIEFLLNNNRLSGIVNAVAPVNTTWKELSEEMCRMKKPLFKIKIKESILNSIFGESAALFTKGQKVRPKKLLKNKFRFYYPDIKKALTDIMITK